MTTRLLQKNIAGKAVRQIRLAKSDPPMSQNKLAARMQLEGFDLSAKEIFDIEHNRRTVTDMELVALAKCLGVTVMEMFGLESDSKEALEQIAENML